jgi:hypothetical protein
MDERDELIAGAIAAAPDLVERDTSFAERVDYAVRRRRASDALRRRAVMAVVLGLSAALATVAFVVVSNALTSLGPSPLSTGLLMTFGTLIALLFRELAQFALER